MSARNPRTIDQNIVRDRTLVLRVLVPGLHTSLNDKIHSKQEGEHSSSLSPATISADQLLNLDGVTCSPASTGSTLWHFRCDGATYPARLMNLPCPVEVHKTFDHANYHKSADIGQVLIVYEDEYAMEEAENEKGYQVEGFPSYYHSGLTPPMRKVVQRRFLSRFEERDTKPAPPPQSVVTAVEKELQELIAKLSTSKGKPKKKGTSPATGGKVTEIKEVEDEIVDYEPWMGEGGIFTVDDAKMHPECWLTKGELKELEASKKVRDEERRLKDQKAAALQEQKSREEQEERKKQEEKAEKKRRKKEKKLKKQKEEEAALAGQKKANAKLKTGTPEEIPVDDLTQVAMAINDGNEGIDEDMFEDMFNFEDDDISNLLI